VDIEELKRIIRLLKEEGLSEITVCEGESRLTVRQEGITPKEAASHATREPGEHERVFTVIAPLVGTFYRRSSPEEEPFVAEGAKVEPGETLCIIEAMKVLNEIKAEEQGLLQQILVEDGETVEYGQVLFLFERP